MKPRIYINDVAVRDGFQIEKNVIATETKVALIDMLSQTGLAKVEVTSFVHPKLVPNMADAAEVLAHIQRVPGVAYTVLVPNLKGMERAVEAHRARGTIDEINVVMSVSETHNRANINRTCEESFADFAVMIGIAKAAGIRMNGTLSTTFGCPFEGHVAEQRVMAFAERYAALGFDGVTLADTTGMGNPAQVKRIAAEAVRRLPGIEFTLHFHNTRGMGLANVVAGIEAGIVRYDGSLGGLGGCPFAPGATGNICTEDMVNMLEDMGYDTGVELDKLLAAAVKLPAIVGHEVPGQVMRAGRTLHLHPVPEKLYTQ
ncbi:MAG: hydroxymethylglutaryl-CoA lyase [Betaproteobacteria bacterium]|nr:hydroxymethylglutaryl-CoA lyase [Betaproteobacteria bacterium]